MCIPFQYKQIAKILFLLLPFTVIAEIEPITITESEPNNTRSDAELVIVNDHARAYKFDYKDDVDWLVFYAQEGMPYEIEIEDNNIGQGINPALTLYNEDGSVEVNEFDFNFAGEGELLSWNAPDSGFYFIKVTNLKAEYNEDANYNIKVYLPFPMAFGVIKGTVFNQCNHKGIGHAILTNDRVAASDASYKDGRFSMLLDPGDYNVTAQAKGYKAQQKSVSVEERKRVNLSFDLLPEEGCSTSKPKKGDANGDGVINTQDIVRIISIILENGVAVEGSDCNADEQMNIQDVVCTINKVLE